MSEVITMFNEWGDALLNIDYSFYISRILIVIGCYFLISGAVGIIRFPDFYTRMHPSGLIDSAGGPLILSGFAVEYGFSLITLKMVILIAFMLYTGAASTHTLARAAITTGLVPKGKVCKTLEEHSK